MCRWGQAIRPGSPGIDAGASGLNVEGRDLARLEPDPLDLGGRPRAVTAGVADPLGSAVYGLLTDHGAYEFQTGIILDLNRDGSIDFLDVLVFLTAFDAAAAKRQPITGWCDDPA
jgi:hypothetical protein